MAKCLKCAASDRNVTLRICMDCDEVWCVLCDTNNTDQQKCIACGSHNTCGANSSCTPDQ